MRFLFLSTILFLSLLYSYSQTPGVEVRAAWLTTNWGLDWPTKGTSVESQKAELCKILDDLKEQNFNTILFQARAQGGVFYKSKIEPLSEYFNHSDGFDPLAFTIEECHKRGMECHAWIITYPMQKAKVRYTGRGKNRKAILLDRKPDYYKLVGTTWYLDPGRPEARSLLLSIVKEIVSNYDVDGIHFDYIRYPSNTGKFPDDDTFKKYGDGKSLQDWRRGNINQLVSEVYDEVKSMKKWVQVSSSPLGRYKVLPEISPNDGWTAYETVFQDAGYWMQSGKHDLVFPMMYYKERYFYPFLDDWMKNRNGRIVVPGLGVYQMDEQNWDLQDILNQVKYTRDNKVQGQAYFRVGNVLKNLKGIKDSISSYYSTPAKLPPLTWLNSELPLSPTNILIYKSEGDTLNIVWDSPNRDEELTYTIYATYTGDVDANNGEHILATGIRGTSYSFPMAIGDYGVYYTLTASNRYHNESKPSFTEFFIHSKESH